MSGPFLVVLIAAREMTTMNVARIFEMERLPSAVVLNLRKGLEEIEFDQPPPDVHAVLEIVRKSSVQRVVVDCHQIDFLRSTALGFFVTLWKRLAAHGGAMLFCNVSSNSRQILRATKLDRVWRICDSRAEAIRGIGEFADSDGFGSADRNPRDGS
jgi:anti-anti-sigma factor